MAAAAARRGHTAPPGEEKAGSRPVPEAEKRSAAPRCIETLLLAGTLLRLLLVFILALVSGLARARGLMLPDVGPILGAHSARSPTLREVTAAGPRAVDLPDSAMMVRSWRCNWPRAPQPPSPTSPPPPPPHHPVLRRSPMRALGRYLAAVTVDPQTLQMSTEPGSGSSIGLHRPRARRQQANRAAKIVNPLDFIDFTTTCTGPEGRQAVQAQAKHACSQKARARGHPAGVGGRA